MRRLIALIVPLLLLAPGTPTAAATQDATPTTYPADAGPNRTDVRFFVPINPGGLNVGLAVTSEERGSCISGSLADAGRPDAWRCTAGNAILDPCFASPFALPDDPGTLACLESPFTGDVVQLTVTESLPEAGANRTDPTQLPWALELANGEQCTLLTGATFAIAGMRVNYGCTGQGSVIGDLDRTLHPWSVSYLSQDGIATTLVKVTAAWY